MSRQKRKSQRSLWPLVAIGAGLLLLTAVVGLLISNPKSDPTPTLALPAEEIYPEIARVSLADAKVALEAGSAVFVDVRDASSYAAAHVEGARSLPLAELDERKGELEPSDWIITYCT